MTCLQNNRHFIQIHHNWYTIGTQLLDIYHVFSMVLFALTNSSSSLGFKWFKMSLTNGCWTKVVLKRGGCLEHHSNTELSNILFMS
jgi:hypothetical protein